MNLFFKKYSPLLVFLAAMLWATDAPFRVYLTKDLSSNFIVLVEHFINLIFVLPLLFVSQESIKKLSKRDWLFVLIIGVGGSALASIAFTQAFHYVNPSVAILLQKLQPFIAILLAGVILKEKMPKKFWAWAFVAVLGAYVISFPSLIPRLYDGEVFNPNAIGVLYALLAALLWGASTVFGKYVLNTVTFEAMTALRFAVAFIFLLGLNFSTGELGEIQLLSTTDILYLIIIGIVSGAMSLLLYYRGLQYTKASIATLAELGFVFASLLINIIFLNTQLLLMQVVGIILLLLAVLSLVRVNREG
ncbi:MAG: DMT family transporter [Patescibacteria group bacterium]